MNIYELSWTWYEDYTPYLFFCETEKTEKEFKADCLRAMMESFDDYMASLDHEWAMLPRWIEFSLDKLCSYGYAKVETIRTNFWGGFIPKKDDDKEESFKDFPEEYFQKIVDYNEKHDKETYKEIYDELEKERTNE